MKTSLGTWCAFVGGLQALWAVGTMLFTGLAGICRHWKILAGFIFFP